MLLIFLKRLRFEVYHVKIQETSLWQKLLNKKLQEHHIVISFATQITFGESKNEIALIFNLSILLFLNSLTFKYEMFASTILNCGCCNVIS